jgi:3',5'-nucleoside bisphosphate phosphatase
MAVRIGASHTGSMFVPSIVMLLALPAIAAAQVPAQELTRMRFPDPPGYVLVNADFHMHTVFSDGLVWPTVRVDEAWRTGLDAIAITDHIEYRPHKEDVSGNLNRSFELAEPRGRERDVIVIRSAEITRKLPPGHLNAFFLNDVNPLNTPDYHDAVKAAIDQGAFVSWDHPNYQHPQNRCEWFKEHTELLEKGWLHGIEVANGRDYYPEAHRWCLEKKLTMICGSDMHNPLGVDTDGMAGDPRPMTIVLAKERTAPAIKEALFARRTVVFTGKALVGEEQWLRPILAASIAPARLAVTLKGRQPADVLIRNSADMDLQLEAAGQPTDVSVPAKLTLYRQRRTPCTLKARQGNLTGTRTVAASYVVRNVLMAPDKGLPVTLEFDVTFSK